MPEDTKVCPYCAETIKAAAVVCRFCGRDLPVVEVTQPEKDSVPKKTKKPMNGFVKILLLLVGGLITACILIGALMALTPESAQTSRPPSNPPTTDAPQPTSKPQTTDAPEPTSTPEPKLELEVVNVAHYPSNDGVVFFGEVLNVGNLPADEPEVSIVLSDKDGGVLFTDSTILDLPLALSLWFSDVAYPGEKAPFVFYIDDPGEWADYKIDLSYEEAKSSQYANQCTEFKIADDTGRYIDDLLYNYRISGEIENTGGKVCGPVRFAITMYDAEGKVVGSATDMLDVDPFPIGEKVPFTFDDYAYGEVASYSILTRAIEQD